MIDRARLGDIVTRLEAKKGPFTFFALLKAGPWPDDWDIVMAAPWAKNSSDARDEVRNALEATFGTKRPDGIRWVKVAMPTDKHSEFTIPLHEILEETGRILRPIEIRGYRLFGVPRLDRVYIYRARPLNPTPDGGTSGAAVEQEPVRVRTLRKMTPTATAIRAGCNVVRRAPRRRTPKAVARGA